MNLQNRFCTFRLGRRLYGIESTQVEEVLGPASITPLPLAPPMVRGLIHLRGRFVTAIDLSLALGLPPRPTRSTSILVRSESGLWSLLVDTVEDIVGFEAAACEPVPATVSPDARCLLHGAYQLDRELLLALDVAQALRLAKAMEPASSRE